MKKLITILLASSLGFTAAASAKQDDPKKKNKSGPPQQQHVKAAPKTNVKVQKNTQNMSNARVNSANTQMKELRKSDVVKPNRTPVPNMVTNNNSKTWKNQKQTTVQNDPLSLRSRTIRKTRRSLTTSRTAPTSNGTRPSTKTSKQNAIPRSPASSSTKYRIQNSQNWSGPQYRVFQNYRPQWHDRTWWRSRYSNRIVLIGGGYYYWNSGYWYPAWGYDSAYSYYPYDGPIYVGNNQVPFDRVLANVQNAFQEQGYYRGEVDGLMGPLTREALANYQRDHGLVSTAALDQPTLASLGLG